MIKALLLDVDGTLLDFNACAEESMRLACRDSGISYGPHWFGAFTQINNRLWEEVEAGTLTVEQLYRIRWNRIFQQLKITYDGPKFESLFLSHLEESACPVDGAVEAVRQAAQRYRIFIASNAPLEQQRKRLEKAGILPVVEMIFASEEIGAAKPDSAYFRYCLEHMPGIRPEEVLMVGDSLSADIMGCAEVGIRSCWYDPAGKTVPEDCRPDYVICRMEELNRL